MKNTILLHIDASPRAARSKSRQLGRDFVARWKQTHASAEVVYRDVGLEPPPFVTAAWVEGAFAPADTHSTEAREAIAVSDRYVDELLAADQILITTPIYNLSLPAALKAWIDQIVRAGRTFTKTSTGFEGLVRGKRVIVVVASGSDFRPSTPSGAYNFLEPYLRAVLGFIGVTEIEFVYAHSLGNDPAVAARATVDAEIALAQAAVA